MPLLEIVKGKRTNEETLYRALDLAKQIKKTPIVVNDSRGFFTSRVIDVFINEGVGMLLEGIPAASIEQAADQAGYPARVLQLSDELSLNLFRKIRDATKAAVEGEGLLFRDLLGFPAFEALLAQGRGGKLSGAGFYEYEDGRRTGLWEGLKQLFPETNDPASISLKDLEERMLFIEALETVKCLDEGVVDSVSDANIGSILGIGFPGWTGGVLQYINGYKGGIAGFVVRAGELAARYGERFQAPASLVERGERRKSYSDDQALTAV
jgi:3-hydroxyacyl-CoA dehydrogenase/enoyl-CoA hydratase/3-hydroxybutyryl-CoA epimerase